MDPDDDPLYAPDQPSSTHRPSTSSAFSSAAQRFQAGARVSEATATDHGLDLLERMASMDLTADPTHAHLLRSKNWIMGFITDENTGAGLALAGVLESGAPKTASTLTGKEKAKELFLGGVSVRVRWRKKKRETVVHHNILGKRNFFIVRSDTPLNDIESAFLWMTKRRDMAILGINSDVLEKITLLVEEHEAGGRFPIIVRIPMGDDPFAAFKDPSLRRPSALGYLPTTNARKLFKEVEQEYEEEKFHFHSVMGNPQHDAHKNYK